MEFKKRVYEFLKEHKLAVISTVNQIALPESAVVGFAIRENFVMHVITYDSSRKYANIKRNPRVALVVGWDHGKTVQIEGEAVEIMDPKQIKEIEWTELEKMPTVGKYIHPERAVFFKIVPKWMRYSDFSTEPWEREELDFI